MMFRCFVAFPREDRLEEDAASVLDERHQAHVILATNDEDSLVGSRMPSRSVWKTWSMPRRATQGFRIPCPGEVIQ